MFAGTHASVDCLLLRPTDIRADEMSLYTDAGFPAVGSLDAGCSYDEFSADAGMSRKASLIPIDLAMELSTPLSLTVSPQELMLDHNAQESAVFTNLTTPSMYDGSPNGLGSYRPSPMLTDGLNAPTEVWYPLFPQATSSAVESSTRYSTGLDVALEEDAARHVSPTATPAPPPTSSVPAVLRARHSSTAGIPKCRRPTKDLSPILVDECDETAFKRAKNTMAARKSRQKKRDVEEQLRHELAAMTAERDRWMHVAIQHGAPLPEM